MTPKGGPADHRSNGVARTHRTLWTIQERVSIRVGTRSDDRQRSFIWDVGSGVASQGLNLVLGLAAGVLLARGLGPSLQGEYAAFVAWSALLALLAAVGFDAGLLPIVNRLRSEGQGRAAAGLAVVLAMVAALLACGLLTLAVHLHLVPTVVEQFEFLTVLNVGLGLIQMGLTSSLVGRGRVLEQNAIGTIMRVVNVVALATLIGVLHRGVLGAIETTLLVSLVGITSQLALLRPVLPSRTQLLTWGREVGVVGIKGFLANASTFLSYRLDQLILAKIVAPNVLGCYALAATTAETVNGFSAALGRALYARLGGTTADLARHCALGWRLVMGVVVPAALVLAGTGRWLIPWIFGPKYEPAVLPFTLLLVGSWAVSMERVSAAYRLGRGRAGSNSLVAGVDLLVNVALNVALIPRLGITGAALASLVSYTVGALLGLRLAFRLGSFRLQDLVPSLQDIRRLTVPGGV